MENPIFFRAALAALELLKIIPTDKQQDYCLLDIGGDIGLHTNFFRTQGFDVDLVDITSGNPKRAFVGDFMDFNPDRPYDVIWASHILEHIQDFGSFLKKMISCGHEKSYLCITVPPQKKEMVFGHVTMWNGGLLLLNLINAGLDCREARILTYGYNISIITPIKLRSDEEYHTYLPKCVPFDGRYFDGDVDKINFDTESIPDTLLETSYENLPLPQLKTVLKEWNHSGFLFSKTAIAEGPRFMWWDHIEQRLALVS